MAGCDVTHELLLAPGRGETREMIRKLKEIYKYEL